MEGILVRHSKIALAAACVIAFFLTGLCHAAEAPKLKLKLQAYVLPGDIERSFTKFVETVSALSNGQIEINVFPVGALVPAKGMLEAVTNGSLDMAQIAEGYYAKVVPVSEIAAGIPFLFRDLDEARIFMWEKGFLQVLREGYAKQNVYVIPWETFPVGLMTKKPIKTVDDLKKMKIRSHGSMADLLGGLGAAPVFIPGGELYTALATGVADGGQWGDAGPMYTMKFHEVLKNYMYPEPIIGSWASIGINMDLWKKMTPEQRSIIEAATVVGGERCYNSTRNLSKARLREMQDKWDVKVNTLPEAETEKMRQYSLKWQNEVAKKDPLCAKGMGMVRDYMKELGYEK
jgi:TRAP-type C4-dicarboxylate transport system substrate-binding protein